MIFAKNISQIFEKDGILAMFAIALFLICTIVFIFLVVYAAISEALSRTIRDIFNSIEVIEIHSIRKYFVNVERIANFNEEATDQVAVWRKRIKKIYDIKLIKLFKIFDDSLRDPKSLKLSKKNLNKFKTIKKYFKELENDAFELFNQLYSFMQEEHLYRNRIVSLKGTFDLLKDDCYALITQQTEIRLLIVDKTLRTVQILFDKFFTAIFCAEYEAAFDEAKNIDNRILFIVGCLDRTPNLFFQVKNVIPDKMNNVINHFLEIQSDFKNNVAQNKINELQGYVFTKSQVILQNLSNLKYISAKKDIEEVLENIDNVRTSIEFGDRLYNVLNTNVTYIENQLMFLETIQINIEKKFLAAFPPSKIISDEVKHMEKAKQDWKKIETEAYKVTNSFRKTTSTFSKEQLIEFKSRILKVIANLIAISKTFDKLNKHLTKKTTSIDKLVDDLTYCQSLITQCEVKIKNNANRVPELQNFLIKTGQLSESAKKISTTDLVLAMQETLKAEDVKDKIKALNSEVENLITDINDAIFLDYISQELIVYLERYSAQSIEIQNAVANLENLYHNRELNQLIGFWIDVMSKINYKQVR
ncbi:septation ring formation regulator EzrA [Spiroplasma clarkii]|nr:hypothetical protein [Spiroplasma clarkii]